MFGFVELFVSPGCKTSAATNQRCHLDISSFLFRMFKFKTQTCGWQGTVANKQRNDLLSVPDSPAQGSQAGLQQFSLPSAENV